jgi:hypothetical protein
MQPDAARHKRCDIPRWIPLCSRFEMLARDFGSVSGERQNGTYHLMDVNLRVSS